MIAGLPRDADGASPPWIVFHREMHASKQMPIPTAIQPFVPIINAKHRRVSTMLTASKGFKKMGSVPGGHVKATAVNNRPVNPCRIVVIQGEHSRIRDCRNLPPGQPVQVVENRANLLQLQADPLGGTDK